MMLYHKIQPIISLKNLHSKLDFLLAGFLFRKREKNPLIISNSSHCFSATGHTTFPKNKSQRLIRSGRSISFNDFSSDSTKALVLAESDSTVPLIFFLRLIAYVTIRLLN